MNNQKRKNIARSVALYGILATLALVCSYVEALVPAFFAIPGMKLGLTNVVVIFALYKIDKKCAMLVNLIRIVLAAFMFGNMAGLIYSLVGGMLSTIVMLFLANTKKFSIIAVSIAGGVTHNIGQILVAIFVLGTTKIAYYFVFLWFSGIITGALIGILGAILVKRISINVNGIK